MRLQQAKITCPRCRSNQKFTPQRRYGSNNERFTVFVKCKVCHKEIDLYQTTDEIEKIKKFLRKVQKEVKFRPTQSRLNLLAKTKKKLYNLESELTTSGETKE